MSKKTADIDGADLEVETPVKNYAVVDAGQVVNVILWDGAETYDPGAGVELVEISENVFAGIGFEWNGTEFIDVRPEPEEVQ